MKYEQTTGIVKKQDQPYFKRIEAATKRQELLNLFLETEQTSRHRDKTCLPREKGRWRSLGLAGAKL